MIKSDETKSCNSRAILFGSIAFNIFLIAFLFGRISVPGFGHHHHHHHMYDEQGMHREWNEGGFHHHAMKGDEREGHEGHGFLGASSLFSPEELKQHSEKMKDDLGKIKELRTQFAKQLQAGPVTKEQALKHFAEVDNVMKDIKTQARDNAAEKISSMTPEQRQQFAEKLLER